MKRHLFYTFLIIFVATSVVTLFGVIGVFKIDRNFLWALVSAFLIESAGAVIALFNRADFFIEDTPRNKDVSGIQKSHAPEITHMTAQQKEKTAKPNAEIAHLKEQPKKRTLYDVLHEKLNRK